jgi:hypothetical protein
VLRRKTVFAVGFVLRYSYFFMLLRKLVREERVVGDVVSVDHTEPVGWWHFRHSYVRDVGMFVLFLQKSIIASPLSSVWVKELIIKPPRANWRKESTSAPGKRESTRGSSSTR